MSSIELRSARAVGPGGGSIACGIERFTASYYSDDRAVGKLIEEADLPTHPEATGAVVEDGIDLPVGSDER